MPTTKLYLAWCQLRSKQPHFSLANYAKELNCTPADLLFSANGTESVFLAPDWFNLFTLLSKLNQVIAISANSTCSIAAVGPYRKLTIKPNPKTAMVLSATIDLRFNFVNWQSAFIFVDKFKHQRSVEFCNNIGQQIHQVIVEQNPQADAIWQQISTLATPTNTRYINIKSISKQANNLTPIKLDLQQFKKSWQQLSDVHHFQSLLTKFKLTRLQAVSQVGAPWSQPVNHHQVTNLLQQAVQQQIPLMIFVATDGCLQNYSGFIHNTAWRNKIFCILDERFNLQIRLEQLACAWLVRKPCKTGWVTSWELYDKAESLVLQIYGSRVQGQTENQAWRQLAESFVVTNNT